MKSYCISKQALNLEKFERLKHDSNFPRSSGNLRCLSDFYLSLFRISLMIILSRCQLGCLPAESCQTLSRRIGPILFATPMLNAETVPLVKSCKKVDDY